MGITDFRSTRTVKYRESVYVPPLPVPVTRKSVDYTSSPKAYQQARPRASTTQTDYTSRRNEQEPISEEEKEDNTEASASSSRTATREEMVTEESFTSALRRGSSASAASSALATPKSDHGHWPGSSASARSNVSFHSDTTPPADYFSFVPTFSSNYEDEEPDIHALTAMLGGAGKVAGGANASPFGFETLPVGRHRTGRAPPPDMLGDEDDFYVPAFKTSNANYFGSNYGGRR